MSFEIKGLNELQNKLKKMSADAQAIHGNNEVKFSDLFPPVFMSRYTQFQSIDELCAKSGFKTDTPEDFKAIPDKPWDDFIAANTHFKNWKDMQAKAGAEWVKKKIGF